MDMDVFGRGYPRGLGAWYEPVVPSVVAAS